jgi:MFS family permease
MPIIGFLENQKYKNTKIFQAGSVFMATGFFFLTLANWIPVLVISIILITLGQIFIFSFANSFALSRAKIGFEGRYMAFYSMSFSVAQVLSPKLSFTIIQNYSFLYNWIIMGAIGVFGILFYLILEINLHSENELITNQ